MTGEIMISKATKKLRKILTTAALAAATLVNPVFAEEPLTAVQVQDLAAIQSLIVQYAHAYDSQDAEGYAAIFAEDAKFSFTGTTLNGRTEIRNFIANAPPANPDIHNFHSISNTLIEFVSDDEAHHRSYWQVVTGPTGGPFNVANMGFYEDVILKRNGEWLIQTRVIPD
jgi:uncharacterized protein (TIGR02246 family)